MAKKQSCRKEDTLETILIKSIHTLVYEKDIRVAMNCFLKTICSYYRAERAYIFEIDWEAEIASNTFEWCAEGVTSEIDRLQGLPTDIVASWIKKFREKGEFYVAALEQEVPHDRADFEILQVQGINSLMAAPLLRDDEIMGFIGVDNPAKHTGDMTLLRSVADFVTADLEKRRLIAELRQASCMDMLTGLKNRNEYMRKFKMLEQQVPHTLGVAFIDINGLKQINDTYGHEYGDAMIQGVADCIKKCILKNIYRIGGDEFVILWDNIEEKKFVEMIEKLKAEFRKSGKYSISIGYLWKEGAVDVREQVKQADASMYEAKQNHYRNRNYDRRSRR